MLSNVGRRWGWYSLVCPHVLPLPTQALAPVASVARATERGHETAPPAVPLPSAASLEKCTPRSKRARCVATALTSAFRPAHITDYHVSLTPLFSVP